MASHRDFLGFLEAGNVESLRSAWAQIFPNFPQPETREQAEIVMHRARTEAERVSFKARAYSHRWLVERGLPSGLPDHLKPKAERIYPRVVQAVGISVNVRNPLLKQAALQVEKAMAEAVEDAFAEGRTDPAFLRARMADARTCEWKRLVGA